MFAQIIALFVALLSATGAAMLVQARTKNHRWARSKSIKRLARRGQLAATLAVIAALLLILATTSIVGH